MYRNFNCGWSRLYAYSVCSAAARGNRRESEQPLYESRHHRGSRASGGFGARRPLRYLSYRLDLDDAQQRKVAAVLDRLKTEMEQARLDEKKTLSDLAGLITRENVSVDDLRGALTPRVETARNLQTVIAKAMQEMSELLDADQREELAYLLQSGAFKV